MRCMSFFLTCFIWEKHFCRKCNPAADPGWELKEPGESPAQWKQLSTLYFPNLVPVLPLGPQPNPNPRGGYGLLSHLCGPALTSLIWFLGTGSTVCLQLYQPTWPLKSFLFFQASQPLDPHFFPCGLLYKVARILSKWMELDVHRG